MILEATDVENAFKEMRDAAGMKKAEKTEVYKIEYKRVFEEAMNSLSECNFSVKESDNKKGIIKESTKMSVWSWGESIIVLIEKTSVGTKVSVSSEAKAQLFDWGKSRRNINNFFENLNRKLNKS